MPKSLKSLTPLFATHPGEVLKDELKARKIKQKDFAKIIGMSPNHLNMILKGHRTFTANLALLAEITIRIDADLWLNMQKNYELDKLKLDKEFQKNLEFARLNMRQYYKKR